MIVNIFNGQFNQDKQIKNDKGNEDNLQLNKSLLKQTVNLTEPKIELTIQEKK